MGGRLKAGARRGCADCQVRLCFDSYRCVFGVRMRGGVERKEYREDETEQDRRYRGFRCVLCTWWTWCFPDEKEGKSAEQTKPDGNRREDQTRLFQDRTFEKPRVGKADKGEHFEAAVKGTTHARAGECVCPSVFWVSVCPLQHLCDKTACHNNDRHPDREVSLCGEVDPKGVFNNSVSEGVE